MFFQQLPSIISVGSLQNYNDADMFGRYCGLPALMCTCFFYIFFTFFPCNIFCLASKFVSFVSWGFGQKKTLRMCGSQVWSGLVWYVITANGNKTDKNNKRTDMAFSQSHDHGPEPLHLWFYTAFQIIMQMFVWFFFPK